MSNRAPILLTDLTYSGVTGAITANGQSVVVPVLGTSTTIITMAAASLSGHNATFECSNTSTDGVNGTWVTVTATRTNAGTSETSTGVLAATPAYGWKIFIAGYRYMRIRATAHTGGTATYTITRSDVGSESSVSVQGGTTTVTGTVTTSGTATITPATPTTITSISSAASTNATSVKASAGTVYGIVASNTGAAAAFVKLYNKASAPTVGTDVPVLTIPIPASSAVSLNLGALGHRFATGIALAITNLAADSDTTAVAAAQVKVLMDSL
jgi:hypothetical protein